jgi:hypothetical protein
MRAAMNANLYLPRSTVYKIFRKFGVMASGRQSGPSCIWLLRERMGREASPSAAVLDSQLVKSAEKGAVTTVRWAMTPASGSRVAKSTL